jgi:hypothetical protein
MFAVTASWRSVDPGGKPLGKGVQDAAVHMRLPSVIARSVTCCGSLLESASMDIIEVSATRSCVYVCVCVCMDGWIYMSVCQWMRNQPWVCQGFTSVKCWSVQPAHSYTYRDVHSFIHIPWCSFIHTHTTNEHEAELSTHGTAIRLYLHITEPFMHSAKQSELSTHDMTRRSYLHTS